MKKLLLILFFAVATAFVVATPAQASEGIANLYSTDGNDYRCAVYSIQLQNRRYHILVSCRDLIYPSDSEVFTYNLWADPATEGKLLNFGQLSFGKRQFEAGRAFTRMFVTKEPKADVGAPSGPVVMEGFIALDNFLDDPARVTPTPTPEPTATPVPSGTEEESPSTQDRVSTGLRRASIILVLFLLFGAVAALVIVLRSRKR